MLFPCCRGPLKINLLSETDSKPRKTACVGRVPSPHREPPRVFLPARGPGDAPGNLPRFGAMAAGCSAPSRALLVLGNLRVSLPVE